MWYAVYDKEINYDKLEQDHSLYKLGMKGECFNTYTFWRWYIYAFVMSIVLILYTFINLGTTINLDNEHFDLWCLGILFIVNYITFHNKIIGSIIYANIVYVVNLKLALTTNTHTIISTCIFFFSLISYQLIIFGASELKFLNVFGVFSVIMKSLNMYMSMILIITVCLLCEYAWMNIRYFIDEIIIKPVKKIVFPKDQKLGQIKEEDRIDISKFNRRCMFNYNIDKFFKFIDTGFAFAEDVANIKDLINSIHDFHFK